jgi:phosphoglycolate phosphatase
MAQSLSRDEFIKENITMVIAFDLDGTLYDCGAIVAPAFVRGAQRFIEKTSLRINLPTSEQIRVLLGVPTEEIFKSLFPGLSADEYALVNSLCENELCADVRAKKGVLYNGVHELAAYFNSKGYTQIIASNGQLPYIQAVLETYSLAGFFKPVVCIDKAGIGNKDGIVAHYKKLYGERMVMIGDRYTDRDAARHNSIPFVGCAFGHTGESEILGADLVIGSLDDLIGFDMERLFV